MKAIVYKKYGSAGVLQIEKLPKPIPKDNEVLIKIHAAEVTKADCEMRSFKFAVKWFWLPLRLAFGLFKPKKQILGGYFSGEIVETGNKVSNFTVGDKVFGSSGLRLGTYGEYLCLPADYTIDIKPSNLTYDKAAAVPLGGLNALHFMRKANIKEGDKVLINGAGGSIGTFSVQIAKSMGAEVTAVDSAIKKEMLQQIGVDFFIDYATTNIEDQNENYDVILNMVVDSKYGKLIKLLNPKGIYLMGNPKFTDMIRSILTTKFTDKIATFAFAGEKLEELTALRSLIEEEKITPVIDEVYPLEQIAEAHRIVETEKRIGIVVISFDK